MKWLALMALIALGVISGWKYIEMWIDRWRFGFSQYDVDSLMEKIKRNQEIGAPFRVNKWERRVGEVNDVRAKNE